MELTGRHLARLKTQQNLTYVNQYGEVVRKADAFVPEEKEEFLDDFFDQLT